MGIGTHRPNEARGTGFQEALLICLDEAFTALEESFHDLTEAQARRGVLPGRNHVVAIVVHVLQNLDLYACRFQCGQGVLQNDPRFNLGARKDGTPPPADDLPTVADMRSRLLEIRETAMLAVRNAGDEELRGPRECPDNWIESGKNAADAIMRTTMHAMTHVRQVWLLRGAMGLTDRDGWPEQHWA